MKNDFQVCMIRHRSAERILVEFLGYDWPVADLDSLLQMTITGMDSHGDCTVGHRLKSIKRLGYWAFCRKRGRKCDPNELHYWLGSRLDHAKLISVFAHELAHVVGWSDETSAIKIADIAGFACTLAKGVRYAR